MGHDVFISHSNQDKHIADAVCAGLEARGIRCWITPRDILPGKSWGEAIIDAIHECPIMVIIFSAASNASVQVLREIERAVNQNVTIVPYRIEDIEMSRSLEYFLSVPHWMDALSSDTEAHVEKLAQTVQALLGTVGEPLRPAAPLAAPPAAPQPRATGTPYLFAGIGGLVVALIAVIVLLLARPWEPPEKTTDAKTEAKTRPDAKVADVVAPEVAPAVTPDVAAEVTPEVAPEKPAPDTQVVEDYDEGIEVKTTPPGALVKIDGQPRGPSPVKVIVDPGTYFVEVSLEGYDGWGEKLEVRPEMVEILTFDLKKLAPAPTVPAQDESGRSSESINGRDAPPTEEAKPTVETKPRAEAKVSLKVTSLSIRGALEDDEEAMAALRKTRGRIAACHRESFKGADAGAGVKVTALVFTDNSEVDLDSEKTLSIDDLDRFEDCVNQALDVEGLSPYEDGTFSTIRFRVGQ